MQQTNGVYGVPQVNQQPMNYAVPMQNPSRIYIKGGPDSAKGYLVQKNNEQVLWDADVPSIYIKSVDGFGNQKLTILDYTIRPTEEEIEANETKALREEVNELRKDLKDIRSFMEEMRQNNRSSYKSYNKKGE